MISREKHEGLNSREGKVLRFIVSRSSGVHRAPVEPEQVINTIEWSDLPHTRSQAMFTFKKLKRLGFIVQDGTGYQATEAGAELIKQASEEHWWQTATGAPIAPPIPKKRNK